VSIAIDPVFGILATAALTLLFAVAAAGKLRDLARFTAVLDAYALVPAPFVGVAARALPALELAVAAGLVVPATRTAAAGVAAGLLLGYAAAIGINLRRGRRDLDCGCDGFGRRHPIAGWMPVRNALMAGLAVVAAAPRAPRALEAVDALTLSAGLVALVLIYRAADELLAQHAQARQRGLIA
jgi:hypothetical protein